MNRESLLSNQIIAQYFKGGIRYHLLYFKGKKASALVLHFSSNRALWWRDRWVKVAQRPVIFPLPKAGFLDGIEDNCQ